MDTSKITLVGNVTIYDNIDFSIKSIIEESKAKKKVKTLLDQADKLENPEGIEKILQSVLSIIDGFTGKDNLSEYRKSIDKRVSELRQKAEDAKTYKMRKADIERANTKKAENDALTAYQKNNLENKINIANSKSDIDSEKDDFKSAKKLYKLEKKLSKNETKHDRKLNKYSNKKHPVLRAAAAAGLKPAEDKLKGIVIAQKSLGGTPESVDESNKKIRGGFKNIASNAVTNVKSIGKSLNNASITGYVSSSNFINDKLGKTKEWLTDKKNKLKESIKTKKEKYDSSNLATGGESVVKGKSKTKSKDNDELVTKDNAVRSNIHTMSDHSEFSYVGKLLSFDDSNKSDDKDSFKKSESKDYNNQSNESNRSLIGGGTLVKLALAGSVIYLSKKVYDGLKASAYEEGMSIAEYLKYKYGGIPKKLGVNIVDKAKPSNPLLNPY